MWEDLNEATKLAAELNALGVPASVRTREYDRGGELAAHYTVDARIVDASSGNGVSRSFRAPTDAKAAAKAMTEELTGLAKAARSHKRSERASGQS